MASKLYTTMNGTDTRPKEMQPKAIPQNQMTKEDKIFELKNKLQKYDCEKMKLLAAYYLHKNQDKPFKEFCANAHCIYLHYFNDHTLCSIDWCKVKRCQDKGLCVPDNYGVNRKFCDKIEHKD